MAGSFGFEIGFGRSGSGPERPAESPLKILYLGDYAADAALAPLTERRWQPLDIDAFDRVMQRLAPSLDRFGLSFASIEDFHPDQLLRTGWFAELAGLRARLKDASTFAQAGQELRELLGPEATPATEPAGGQADPATAQDATFARLLGEESTPIARRGLLTQQASNLRIEKLLQQAVAPYLEPDASPDQGKLLAAVDGLLAARLRALLHDPQFQGLEAAWRWLEETVRRVEVSAALQLAVLPVAREELAADPAFQAGELTRSQLFETLIVRDADAIGQAPWTFVVADYRFNNTDEDIRLLSYLSALAGAAGAQLITGATPELAGCTRLDDLNAPERWHPGDHAGLSGWQAFRESDLARTVVATVPRVLTRYPYTAKLNPVEFDFDELDEPGSPCLWGNAAYGCAIAVAQAFAEHGWSMDTAVHASIDDLPTWQIEQDGAATAQPTTEARLGESAAAALIDRGLTPICPVQGTNEARIFGLHTAALS